MITPRVSMLVAACVVAVGCATERTSEQKTDSTTVAMAPAPNVVVVRTKDFAFDAPDAVPGGLTTIRLVTNPGQELHQVAMIRLDSGKTVRDFFNSTKGPGPLPAWAVEVAGVNPPAPGQTADVTLTLEPGSYLLVCFVPSADGVPHIAKGMSRPLTVTGNAVTTAALTADIEMDLTDYAFGLSTPLTAGTHVVRVVNNSQQTHEVQVVRLAPGKTAADVAAWIGKQQGPPPGEPLSGVAGLGVGKTASFPLTLTPGEYALLCFIPDAKDGKPHFVHGMMQNIKVS